MLNYNNIQMQGKNEIIRLLSTPLCMMTGEEFLQLNELAKSPHDAAASTNNPIYAQGVEELAEKIGCSQSTVYSLKRQGVLDDAIVSNIGRKIIFDVEKARELADAFQRSAREVRHGK